MVACVFVGTRLEVLNLGFTPLDFDQIQPPAAARPPPMTRIDLLVRVLNHLNHLWYQKPCESFDDFMAQINGPPLHIIAILFSNHFVFDISHPPPILWSHRSIQLEGTQPRLRGFSRRFCQAQTSFAI